MLLTSSSDTATSTALEKDAVDVRKSIGHYNRQWQSIGCVTSLFIRECANYLDVEPRKSQLPPPPTLLQSIAI